MRGLASFCLFGEDRDDVYRRGALKNAELYSSGVYPPTVEVISRFYVSPLSLEWAMQNLDGMHNVEVVCVDAPEDLTATFWRFRALEDKSYDFYLLRDIDSRPILRERLAVQEWLESDKTFHVMRDHPYHNVPMLAGLWGMKNVPKTANVHKIFRIKTLRPYYQVDQMYLKLTLWRMARKDCLSHVDCEHLFGDTDVREFPIPRGSEGFCGEGFYGDGRPRFPHHSRDMVG